VLLVQNFLHGDELDDSPVGLVDAGEVIAALDGSGINER